MIVFGFLAIFDLLGSKRINITIIMIGIFIILLLNSFSLLKGILLYAGLISIIILLFIKRLGLGDKLVLATSFLIYPFYFIWIIIILALFLSKPFLSIKHWFASHFYNRQNVSVAFYPFLFISSVIIYFILSII
jgi:hypothetical protein